MKSISTASEEFSEAENEKHDLPQSQMEGTGFVVRHPGSHRYGRKYPYPV